MLPTAHTRFLALALENGMQCRFRVKKNEDGSAELRLRVETAAGQQMGWAIELGSSPRYSAIATAMEFAAVKAIERLFPEAIFFIAPEEDKAVIQNAYVQPPQRLQAYR